MNRKVIPLRNYFIVTSLFIFLILFTYYLIAWYETTKNYTSNNLFNHFLAIVKVEELDNYIIDNPDIVIYLADSYDKNNDDFEKEFKQYIIDNNLKKEFVYIDNRKNKNYESIEKYLSQDLKNKNIGIVNNTNLLLVKDGLIVDILYKNNKEINLGDVKIFLTASGVIGND